ncbi:MAG: uncharacterized protein KVP18_001826 [Porospora cf. gigantea A]|uniref:uncharacterized protein n=1 Tax=Porospora cf. gigantea A TaxID=2853593 RepID=UPI0035598A60|nr:MAG: hypothetical protein KVP18_001826 [Porospora cf. gigantea A]
MPVPHADFDCANDLMPAVHSIKLRTLNCIAQQLAEASCESREEAEEFDAYRLPYPLHVPCTCRSRSGRVPVFRRWSDGPAVVDLVNSVLSLNAGLQEFLHLLSPEKQFLMDIAKSLSLPTSASDSLACRISSAVAKLSPCRFLRSVSMAFCPLLLSHLRMIRALGCLVLDAAHEEHQHLFSFVSKAVKAILDAFGVLLLSRGQAWEATLQRQLVQGGLPAAREYLLVESSLLGSVSWTLLKVYHELLSENTQDVRIPLDAAHDVKAVAKSSLAALRALMLNRSRQLLDHFSRSYCVPLLEESLECEKWERQVSLAGSKLERLVQSKCVPLLGGDRDLIPANGLQFESDGPERCTTISVLRFVSAITE